MSDQQESRMTQAAATGDPLTMLLTLRDMLAERFDKASPRDSAALARQLQLVAESITRLQAGDDMSDDKLASLLNSWEAE